MGFALRAQPILPIPAFATIAAQINSAADKRVIRMSLARGPIPWGKIAAGGLVVVVSFAGAVWAMNRFLPSAGARRPVLVEVPPLKPVARTSVIVTPAAVALTAIRDSLERAAPRDLNGKRDNPISQLLSNAELGWTVSRGPLAVAGKPDGLAVSTALTGTFRATGQLSNQAGNLTGQIGNLLGGNLGQSVQKLTEKTLDQRADIKGNVTVTSRPALQSAWRMEPNLTAQVAIADASMAIMGAKVSISNEVKPLLDRTVNEQVAALQARVRNDPFLEVAARREWVKLCRSISLGSSSAGMPNLWLELRPTRAFAGQ